MQHKSTLATFSCTGTGTGTGYVRLNVRCNAIWPFIPWTDTGPRVYLTGGRNIVNQHISCAASLTDRVVYGWWQKAGRPRRRSVKL